jgi:hypothetical protein
MTFTDDFSSCMDSRGLPTPSQVFDSVSDALEFLHQLHDAWESAGGDEEMTLAALAALGAAAGIDEGVLTILGAAGAATVSVYLSSCFMCLVTAWTSTGTSWSDFLASADDSWVKDQLTVAANDQGVDTSGTADA